MKIKRFQIIILIGCALWIFGQILEWQDIYPFAIILFYISPPLLITGIVFWLLEYKKRKGGFPNPIRTYKKEREKHSGIFGTHFTMIILQFRYILEGWTFCVLFWMILALLTGLLFKGSDAYKTAENYLKENEDIYNKTGGIEYFDILPSGSISSGNSSNPGLADLSIKLIGKDNNLNVKVRLVKYDKWEIDDIEYK